FEIIAVPTGGQVGGVAIPVEEVEGSGFLAEQVIVDHVAPNEVTAAKQVEGRGHVAPVEIALLGSELGKQPHGLVTKEKLEVAGLAEIHLGGEKGRRFDLRRIFMRMKISQRRSERRTSHAIADSVHRIDAQDVADRVDRVDLALEH